MFSTSKNVLFPGYNHLLPLVLMTLHFNYHRAGTRAIIKVSDHQQQLLAYGYDMEIGQF